MENKLIPISITAESDVIVSGREMHDFLGVELNFRLWFAKMMEYGFVENLDYKKVYEKRGEEVIVDYMMSSNMAKEIATIQKSEKGKQARNYFINVEKKFNSVQVALKNFLEMTKGYGRTYEEMELSHDYYDEDEPGYDMRSKNIKAGRNFDEDNESSIYKKNTNNQVDNRFRRNNKRNLVNTSKINNNGDEPYKIKNNTDTNYLKTSTSSTYEIEESNTLCTNFRDTAKLFGIRENLLVNYLLLNDFCYRDKKGVIKFYAKYMDYFKLREYTSESGHCGMQTLISKKGREFFRNLLTEEEVIKI